MFPQISNITFAENEERLKVVLPLRRQWVLFILFTISMLIWVGMIVVVAVFLVRDVLPQRERYTFILTVMMLVWLALWYYLGKVLWKRWQYYTADREILFVSKEMLIVRRPVSILGITDAYDMQYVNPFYYNHEHHCLVFDYGSQRIYFGEQLAEEDAHRLLKYLNHRFFPYHDDEDDD
ncbi:MAG: hypothetical protein R3E31_26095 [Chloroflexota bacterium]|nr:hypothetical protein [Anaerolineales bacterium]MCA9974815.1 hypothetical protein [Anaerolineales bacterium]MCB8967955.1 hypothetical protein [Ardenticatenaceae bacterium]